MLLTEYNICHYLMEKGMLELKTLIAGKFTARRNDSRNNNFIINKEFEENKYFIKQVKANDLEKIETLRTEAGCYQLANADAHYKVLKDFLPAFHYYDPLNNVLVIEQVKDALSMHDFYFQFGSFENNLPQLLADTLASYHTVVNRQMQSFPHFRQLKPWVFTLVTAPPAWPAGPQPSVEHQILQLIFKNAEFVQLLRQLETEWQPGTLIHNDVKFNNFLLNYDYKSKKINSIKLIDWELADMGDPLWDVAAIMQNYLALWLLTDVPELPGMQPAFKKINLEEVQPCINAFWKRYTQQLKFDPAQQRQFLVKAIKFAALKLIHFCFELAPGSATLQPGGVKMLQMSFNILRSPENAGSQLFGIK
jgi:serine/threonine protein kinase